jgi:putative SOS response-associated peptidase YedK
MCFRVVFDKTIIGKQPIFSSLLNESFPEGNVSAFHFPKLPVITSEFPQKAICAQWGLVPNWVKTVEQAKKIRSGTVNARSETIQGKPSFRNSWPRYRCLLPVSGFFEPHEREEEGKTVKETWKIEREDSSLFYLGGIYAVTPENLLTEELIERDLFGERPASQTFLGKTFSLLTLEASGLLAQIHNGKLRMPFIMSEERALEWIGYDNTAPRTENNNLFDTYWQMDQKELRGFKINSTDSR